MQINSNVICQCLQGRYVRNLFWLIFSFGRPGPWLSYVCTGIFIPCLPACSFLRTRIGIKSLMHGEMNKRIVFSFWAWIWKKERRKGEKRLILPSFSLLPFFISYSVRASLSLFLRWKWWRMKRSNEIASFSSSITKKKKNGKKKHSFCPPSNRRLISWRFNLELRLLWAGLPRLNKVNGVSL